MNVGATRKFKIDKRKKKNCGLPGTEIVEVEIRKEKSVDFEFIFRMVNTDDEVFVHCGAGYVVLLKVVGKAEQCGIGKILMQLCLSETKIHNVEDNHKNKALEEMDEYVKRYKDVKFNNLRKWIISHCKKVFYLEMEAHPRSAAHVYFNSALVSGFTEMFMLPYPTTLSLPDDAEPYPKEGPCSVKMLKEKYTDDGQMEDGGKKTMVWGMDWFFCYPIKPEKVPKCTIL